MASTKANRTITLEGPIFDAGVREKLYGAISDGIKDVAEEGEGILMGFISASGFESTGAFLHSVTSEMKKNSGNPDSAKLTVTADWQHEGAGHPTKTWFESGLRSGVKLRKASGGFSKTATRMRSLDFDHYIGDKIEKALN